MTNERKELLKRMEKALLRMERDGAKEENCKYYLSFKSKYEAVKNGAEYKVNNVAPYLIAYVGSMIPTINQNVKGEIIPTKKNINRHEIALKTVEFFNKF